MVHRFPDRDDERISGRYATNEVDNVVVDHQASRNAAVFKLQQAIYLLFGFIEALIAIRFVLRLLGANPSASFASAIYAVTGPFVAPFTGIFGTPQFSGSVLEPHSIVAIIMYALLAWLIAQVVWLLMGDTRAATATTSTTVVHERDHEHEHLDRAA
jgi:YggT family protein